MLVDFNVINCCFQDVTDFAATTNDQTVQITRIKFEVIIVVFKNSLLPVFVRISVFDKLSIIMKISR